MAVRFFAVLGLSAALLPALPPVPANAASFDCSKASTTYERTVCDNPDLSALDDTLAIAFATATGGLSKAASAKMRENQRAWIAYVGRACTADAEPRETPYTEEQISCLNNITYTRIRELEQSRMENGWRFYMDESFTVLKADQEESGSDFNMVATKIYSSPRMDGDSMTAREFNAFAADLLETIKASAVEGGGPNDRTSDIETVVKVTAATSQRITLTTTDSWYGHGAAHGNYTITYAHFLPAEGRALTVEDVFAGEDWVEPVADLAYDELKASLGEYMWDDLKDPVKGWVADPARWNFSDQGLIIQFQPYEVTAYAAGAPTITIPWVQLEKWTSANIYGIAYY